MDRHLHVESVGTEKLDGIRLTNSIRHGESRTKRLVGFLAREYVRLIIFNDIQQFYFSNIITRRPQNLENVRLPNNLRRGVLHSCGGVIDLHFLIWRWRHLWVADESQDKIVCHRFRYDLSI